MRLDAYMTLSVDGTAFKGESTDEIDATKDDEPIEILSFEQLIEHDTTQDAKNVTIVANHRPLTVIKPLDHASPALCDIASKPPGKTGLTVGLGLVHRKGTSKDKNDKWTREVYFYLELKHAYISRMRLVADPRLHHFGRTSDFPIADEEVLSMGPLEEIQFTYRQASWWYGKTSNKKAWTHPSVKQQ